MNILYSVSFLVFSILATVILKIFSISQLRKYLTFQLKKLHYLACKQNVAAGINALMSIRDGLVPSISGQKMERTRPMREVMGENIVFFSARVGIPTLIY